MLQRPRSKPVVIAKEHNTIHNKASLQPNNDAL